MRTLQKTGCDPYVNQHGQIASIHAKVRHNPFVRLVPPKNCLTDDWLTIVE